MKTNLIQIGNLNKIRINCLTGKNFKKYKLEKKITKRWIPVIYKLFKCLIISPKYPEMNNKENFDNFGHLISDQLIKIDKMRF